MSDTTCRLPDRNCTPCLGKEPPLHGDTLQPYLGQLPPQWTVVEEHHLVKTFKFKDFKGALAFVNAAGAVAEAQGHHPVIEFTWGRVTVTLWTHKINGLSENDFILAAKLEALGGQ